MLNIDVKFYVDIIITLENIKTFWVVCNDIPFFFSTIFNSFLCAFDLNCAQTSCTDLFFSTEVFTSNPKWLEKC